MTSPIIAVWPAADGAENIGTTVLCHLLFRWMSDPGRFAEWLTAETAAGSPDVAAALTAFGAGDIAGLAAGFEAGIAALAGYTRNETGNGDPKGH